jgi:hypothetical protein
LAFDAPTREECTAERPISSTPSAALVLLNDPQFVEAARALAVRILTDGPAEDEQRIRWAWRLVLSRHARPDEVSLLSELLRKHRAAFDAAPGAADALTSVGISPRPKSMDTNELAAWTSIARVLLNLNETITRN